jgi:hypothetical protein
VGGLFLIGGFTFQLLAAFGVEDNASGATKGDAAAAALLGGALLAVNLLFIVNRALLPITQREADRIEADVMKRQRDHEEQQRRQAARLRGATAQPPASAQDPAQKRQGRPRANLNRPERPDRLRRPGSSALTVLVLVVGHEGAMTVALIRQEHGQVKPRREPRQRPEGRPWGRPSRSAFGGLAVSR